MSSLRTIRDAVNAFKNFMEDASGRQHRQFIYPDKLVYYYLNLYANTMRSNYGSIVSNSDLTMVQTIPCVMFEGLDIVECPCAPTKGCTFYKNVTTVPPMINGMPTAVNSVDGFVSYDYLSWYNFRDKLNSRLMVDRTRAYFTLKQLADGVDLYLYSSNEVANPKAAAVTGVFTNPLDVLYYRKCDGDMKPMCNPLDDPFILPVDSQAKVFEATRNALLSLSQFTNIKDSYNNEANDTKQG